MCARHPDPAGSTPQRTAAAASRPARGHPPASGPPTPTACSPRVTRRARTQPRRHAALRGVPPLFARANANVKRRISAAGNERGHPDRPRRRRIAASSRRSPSTAGRNGRSARAPAWRAAGTCSGYRLGLDWAERGGLESPLRQSPARPPTARTLLLS